MMHSTDNENLPDIVAEALEGVEDTEKLQQRLAQQDPNFTPDRDPEFVAAYLKAMFVEDIWQAMDAQGVSRAELARRLGKSRQYVGRVLHESANFTLESIAELACVLGMRVALRLHDPAEMIAFQPNPNRATTAGSDKHQETSAALRSSRRSKVV